MRLIASLFALLSILPSFCWAALATDADTAISFYRSKHSLFPSGQVSRSELENKVTHTETEVAYRAGWDNKEYTLQAEQILRDIQVARFVETNQTTPLFILNRTDSTTLKMLSKKTELEILAIEDFWARVQEKNGKLQGWVQLQQLQNNYEDLGVFTNLIDTYIRKTPSSAGSILTTLPRLRRIIPLEITKQFLKVEYEGQTGFVDITHFVSRANFATLAYHPQKNWVQVLYRNNDALVTKTGESLPLKEILGYITNPQRGIIKKADPSYGPPLRARVDLRKQEAYVWALSELKGHGEVWWKKKDLLVIEDKPSNDTTITTETLMKREIYSIAFENKNSVRGLVSSEGVYRTEDGQTWTLIPQFSKQNLPVSIHPNGTWFVGSYKSRNGGKSFEPFIRWDKIAKAIETTYHRNPRIMKLTQIEALPNSRIQIQVDTGSNKVKLRSLIGDLNWDVIKN